MNEVVPGQLRWRCRRGMKELDLLLLRFAEAHWPGATAAERAAFDQVLELPDPVLAAYVLGHESPPPDLAPILDRLRGG